MGKILRIALLLVICMAYNQVWAQIAGTTVSGTVSDEKGETLPGVTVTVKEAQISAITNVNGQFSLNVPATGRVLRFSFVGMQPQEISINGRTVVNVILKSQSTALTDVVVIGYGAIRKADVTTAISSVSEKDIKNLPVAGIDQALQGKVAGVSVTTNGGQPGGGVSVRVRGITSTGGNEPLYVIDGVQIAGQTGSQSQDFLGGGTGSTAQSVLATLNPSDIVSIDVLKDAAAQAIYGSRAGNGVVIITTKRGRAGQSRVTYDTYYGLSEIPKKLKVLDLRQSAEYSNSLVGEIRATGAGADSVGEFANPAVLGHGTDWQDEIYRRGIIANHQLSFSGGADKTNYFISGNYFSQEGTLIKTGFKRYTLRASIDDQVKDWLKVGLSANLSKSNQQIGLANGFDAVTSVVLYNSPATPIRDAFGNYITQLQIGNQNFGQPNNPVALAQSRDVSNGNSRAIGNLYAEIKFMKGLTLRNEGNFDFNLTNGRAYQPFLQNSVTNAIILSPSRLREERNQSFYYAIKNYLNYDRAFGKHSINATLGHEFQRSQYDYISASRNNLTLNLVSLNAGQSGDGSGETIGAGAGITNIESYFARVNYAFDQRYAISATVRRDYSSQLGPDVRVSYFPGVSASWTATNESFLKGLDFLNYLKLRVGAGEVGNANPAGAFAYLANITLFGTAPFGAGGIPANVQNPNLTWETVRTYNAGIDATIFKNKIELTVDVYKKSTIDLILPTQLAAYSGLGTNYNDIQTPITNAGKMTNTGIDVSITSYNIRDKNFNWKTTAIFSHYKNVLNQLNNDNATIPGRFNEYGTSNLVTLTQVGQPVGVFYGYVTDGLFRTQAELNNGVDYGLVRGPQALWVGDIRFKDLNGDGKVDDKDVTVIGNPNPDFTYGLTNTFSYKGIDLSIFLQGSYGNDIFNYTRRQTEALNNPYINQLTTVLDRYTAANPAGSLPRYNQWQDNNRRISDRYIEDGSYLRIQNISVGYNLPKKWISKVKMSTARVFISGQNLYTFTNYSGYDPELGAINNSSLLFNIDNGSYPIPRTFTAGVNIEF
ncbi:SusC/RagA family TonB-linked outer membrane protein [Mucilaginibacter terrae]|uniref:SusC/RagA family TonB-linked outer membrane protein n=1 Tax=Mucilaginibacter terrae TaxID=1955052 RepID=UPI003637FDBB